MASEKWEKWAIQKYGSLEIAKEIRRKAYLESRKHPNANKGGFHALKKKDKNAMSELSRQAVNKRWEKVRADKEAAESKDEPQS